MTPLLYNQALELLMLADAIAGDLTGAELRLYQNNVVFDPVNTVIGDLTEATYAGYAEQTLVWGAPSVSDDGNVETIAPALTFRPTSSATPNEIYGFYVTTAGGALIMGGTIDGGPLPMNSTLDVIAATAVFRFNQTGYISVVS